jgi:hypothetical protein
MNKFLIKGFIVFFLLYMISHASLVHAEYVLPYPSYMPGNTLYKISTFLDTLKKYWYFGNIAQLTYHMNMADKKLVEAKTLFEYKQYALALSALGNSKNHVELLPTLLIRGKRAGIDMKKLTAAVCGEMGEHQKVIQTLKESLPITYTWQEEKKDAIKLSIQDELDHSMKAQNDVVKETCL